MRKIHVSLIGVLALLFAAVGAPPAQGAQTRVKTDQFSGRANARALDLSLLGRRFTFGVASTDSAANAVAGTLQQKASGIGTLLSPKAAATASQGGAEGSSPGGRACYQPPLAEPLSQAGLPALVFGEAACGEAKTSGDVSSFEALGKGAVASLRLNAARILEPALDALRPALGPVAGESVGQLLKATDEPAQRAVSTLNGLFDSLLGQGSVVLPNLEPSQTVQNLIDRLGDTDFVRINLGNAVARTSGQPGRFVTESVAEGGTVEVLPGFRAPGGAPLLRITTGQSGASVTYQREQATGTGSATNTLVRIEGELLPKLKFGQIGVAGVKPFAALTDQLGIKTGSNSIELAPGQNISLFCDATTVALGALCTEISVGTPKETKLPDGGLREEAAAVTVHLFKGLDKLVPGANLGTVLASDAADAALDPVASASNLSLGEKTGVPGIRLALAQTVAEAGGTRALGEIERQRAAAPAEGPAPAPVLPRTGGLPYPPGAIAALAAVSVGLGRLLQRQR